MLSEPNLGSSEISFEFVPYSEQKRPYDGLDLRETWQERIENPKVHNILVPVDFSDLPPSDYNGCSCIYCRSTYRTEVTDFVKRWGDIEQLNFVVPNTPTIVCECELFTNFDNDVGMRMSPVWEIRSLISHTFFYFEDEEERIQRIFEILGYTDFQKLMDFIENHWAPEGSPSWSFRNQNLTNLGLKYLRP